MANAQEVLAQLTTTWSSMLDKFYDSVSDEYIKWMAKEYNMEIKALREKAAPLKAKLLSKAAEAVNAVKTTKKQNVKVKVVDTSKYGTLSRKELMELCKNRSLPIKRKNQDMIDQLKTYDENNEEKPKENSENESDSEQEPELESEKKENIAESSKPKNKPLIKPKLVSKKPKATPPPKNELMEEPLESDSDND